MNRINTLQALFRQFSKGPGKEADFRTIEKILQKDLGLERATLYFREKAGLKSKRLSHPPVVPDNGFFSWETSTNPRSVISSLKQKNKGSVVWPIWVQGELVACYGLGPKWDKKPLAPDEEKLMELLVCRTALYLKERQLWKLLEMANRRSMLDLLSAAMLHEIRNPLTALSTLAQLFPQRKKDERFLDSFEKVVPREIERLLQVTGKLLDFSKPAAENETEVHLEDVVDHVTELLKPHFRTKNVELTVRQDRGLVFKGNSRFIEMLVLNLLLNAFQSVGKGGKIVITTRLSRKKQTAKEGPRVWFEVKDNGKGIAQEDIYKITEPFFSTRLDGTGLGLTISQNIVRNHRGYMRVKSSPAGGARFMVSFPAVPGK